MSPQKAVLTPFHLTQNDGNVTKGNGTASTWSDIWKFQVPQGTGLILQAGDLLSAYISDGAEVGQYNCYLKVEVRDPSENDVELVYGPGLYKKVREFQDRNTMARLAVAGPVKVYPRQWVVIAVYDDGTVAYASSYFDLFTSKIAVPMT